MIATARAQLRLVKGRHILAIETTTLVTMKRCGLNLHPMIAVDAHDGGLIGLVDAVFLNHVGGQKHLCKSGPLPKGEPLA